MEYTAEISKIGDSAAKEYTIEKTLEKMQSEWENLCMELSLYKTTGF